MPDITAIELTEREASAQLTTSVLGEVRRFVTGALFTVALAAAGTVLFTIALAVAVVGSPLIAAAIVVVIVRRQRAERMRPAFGAAT